MDIIKNMSKRLLTVADMLGSTTSDDACLAENVQSGSLFRFKCAADVGCDHGYVSIYLVEKGIADSAIAMDVRPGPLSMARSNISAAGLSDSVTTRLSDGLSELKPGEADALVIAGMGGKLMISILEKKDLRALGIRAAVLQPQSDIDEFRQYIRDKGYEIEDERIVLEDGKYYFPMRVKVESEGQQAAVDRVSVLLPDAPDVDILRLCNRYGEHSILRRDPLLKAFLFHGGEVLGSILQSLNRQEHRERFEEVLQEKKDIEALLKLF